MRTNPCAERYVIELVRRGELTIDDAGRVWRVAARRGLKKGGSHVVACEPRRAENVVPKGYMQVRAVVGGRRWYACAQRLVWQYFYGDIPDGLTVNHKNGDKADNRPTNLELATDAEQTAHATATGLRDDEARRKSNGQYGHRPGTALEDLPEDLRIREFPR